MIQSSVEFFKNLPPKQCTECGKKLKNSTNVMETTVIIAFLESSSNVFHHPLRQDDPI